MRSIVVAVFIFLAGYGSCPSAASNSAYLGFDRNDYPGDQSLQSLHHIFSFVGYWLNPPPGEKSNSWTGKREILQDTGFGFLVLLNGRLYAELKSVAAARNMGVSDAHSAVAAARREGFPNRTIVFLDQEQGGRMLPEQKSYIYAWVDAVAASGFRAGIYCSGIASKDDGNIVTANDIRQTSGARDITYFVTNDQCPPSPGCVFSKNPAPPSHSGARFADVWQFAQSPRRMDFASGCKANYGADGNCYPPRVGEKLHVDIDTATSADPSQGRTH